jgi:hypothetical protein
MDTCDPNAEIADLRKLIKMNTGHSIKLTREQICQVYDDIQGGKLPLPPLVLDSKMSYLIDKKSPLTPKDFDVLFDSSSKRTDLKRIARKVGLVKTEQMTKNQIFDAIGKRLRYMNVHEPIKISRKRLLSSKSNTAANNAAVNNLGLNNAAANNAAANNLGLNNTGNSGNNLGLNNTGNTGFNNTGNNVNRNRNFNNNSAFNSGGGSNNLSNNASSKPNSKVSFPNKSLFATMNKPDFAKNQENMSRPKPMFTGMMGSKTPNFINSNKKKTSFFGGLFGGSKNNNKNKNFIKANKFNKAKPGYAFKTGNQGLGYYKNEGPVVAQGPLKKPNGFGEPVAPVGPNNKKPNKVNIGVGNNTVNNKNNKPNKVNIGVGNNTVNNKNNKPVNNKKPNKVNIGVGNNTVNNKNNKPNKVNIGVGNNTVNNKNNKPNKVNIGVGNNTVNNKNNNGNTIMTNANANNKNNNGNTIMTNANANNKNNNGNTIMTNANTNNKNNNGNTIMTNANNNTKPNSNVKPNNNANNQARRNEENRKKAEKEAQEAKKEAAREELRKRQEEIKKKREETKRVANIEKNLLKLPNVDKVYLTAFRGNKSVENVNKNALLNKVAKDKIIRNLRNQLSPLFMGKRRIAYVNPTNYNAMKKEVENKLAEKTVSEADLQLLKKLSTNLAISKNYVKAFANGKAMSTISVNALTNKRNKDLEVYKLNATNKKGIFGGYSTTVPGTKTMKFIPNAEYNKTLNRAKTALEARRNAKQLAENKRKPKPNNNANNTKPNGNAKPNNNANNTKPNGNVKPNNNANNAKPNGNVKPNNAEFMGPNNKLNTIEEEPNKENASGNNFKNASNNTFKLNKNTKNKIQNNNNFNASAELNKQLNNEAKRQNRAKNKNNNNNFNAAAELNKQLNNEGKRVNRAAKNKNKNNNFNAAAELNKQLNNEGKRQQNVENKKLANRRKNLTNKTEKEVAKFMGRIGKWRPAIINAKTITELNNLNKNLNNRIKLRNNIKKSVLTRKEQSEYANMVMKLNKKVANTRKLFENGVNKKISNTTGPLVKGILNKAVANNKRGNFNGGERLGNNNNNIINGKPKPVYNNSNSNSNNNVKPNMKPNPTFEPNMENNPTFEVFENKKPNNKPKITNENLRPMKSAIGGLKQLPKNKKSGFESRLNAAFKNQNLNKMKAIRNEAIAANKTIQNQLAEEKRLKEEAKEAQRKKEAENAARRKAERNAKKKAANEEAKKKVANNMKRQLNAANNILNLANKALKKKENNKAPTLMERGSYTSKINTQMKKLAKGTTNRVREDWEKKKRTFKGRITRAATIGQVKKAYENAKAEYNKLK